MAKHSEDKISGVQKAAILLITLGPEKSANIFKHLKEEEIEELTLEIANTRSVTPQVKEEVINEFYEVCLAQQYIAEGGITSEEYMQKLEGFVSRMTNGVKGLNNQNSIVGLFIESAKNYK